MNYQFNPDFWDFVHMEIGILTYKSFYWTLNDGKLWFSLFELDPDPEFWKSGNSGARFFNRKFHFLKWWLF